MLSIALAVAAMLSVVAGVPIDKDPFHPGCITAGAPVHSAGAINVHIVPHTHDDVGWLKTVDQYYYGANNSIAHAGVQYILDTVVAECLENPDRKFTYVEQAFFQRWWTEQSPFMKKQVRALIKKGQLQFINGGWSMHDEACTHFVSMIENTAFGHRFLKEQFDYVPNIGWQIDPFGHSATQATLLSAEVGFDALYFARIDWQEAKARKQDQSMELVWRPSESLGKDGEVFTGAFLDGDYEPPPGFCFDGVGCNGGFPVMDDLCMEDPNVKWYVDKFVAAAQRYASMTRGDGATAKNVMFLMGSDFQYENADGWYKNLDKIIHYVNKDGRVNAFYSTPIEYTDAKYKENRTWDVKYDDFLPLANDEYSYWSGFFTSRPTLKRYERVQAGYLQGARQLQLFSDLEVNKNVRAQLLGGRPWYRYWMGMDRHDMDPLAAAVALNQHHDAITGTEMQHVTYDYAARLAAGGAVADEATKEALAKLVGTSEPVFLCKLFNESVCEASNDLSHAKKSFTVLVYNPYSSVRTSNVRIPVAAPSTVRLTGKKHFLDAQVVPSTPIASAKQALQNQAKASPYELVIGYAFEPFAITSFTVEPSSASKDTTIDKLRKKVNKKVGQVTIENDKVVVSFDTSTGLIKTVKNKVDGSTTSLTQNFFWYKSAQGDGQKSGAYIFRPDVNHTDDDGQNTPCVGKCTAKLTIVKTAVVSEVHQVFSDWVAQTVRVYAGREDIELEWTVGPIPFSDGFGKEVISRFSTDVKSGDSFFTDSNGRDMLERKRCTTRKHAMDTKCRPSVKAYNVTEPVASNYFPINTQVLLKDSKTGFSISVDRSQGGASLIEGQVELMVHRRLLQDDARGVAEPLNETQSISPYDWKDKSGVTHHNPYRIGKGLVARGKHWVSVTSKKRAPSVYRRLQSEIYYEPVIGIVPAAITNPHHFKGLQTELPEAVEILTVEKQPAKAGRSSVLIRVAHKFGVGEDETMSVPVKLPLSQLFSAAHLATPKKIVEMSLSANQLKKDMIARRRHFKTDGNQRRDSKTIFTEKPKGKDALITLAPLQIRTFMLHY